MHPLEFHRKPRVTRNQPGKVLPRLQHPYGEDEARRRKLADLGCRG
jgi:hypothetical protein